MGAECGEHLADADRVGAQLGDEEPAAAAAVGLKAVLAAVDVQVDGKEVQRGREALPDRGNGNDRTTARVVPGSLAAWDGAGAAKPAVRVQPRVHERGDVVLCRTGGGDPPDVRGERRRHEGFVAAV